MSIFKYESDQIDLTRTRVARIIHFALCIKYFEMHAEIMKLTHFFGNMASIDSILYYFLDLFQLFIWRWHFAPYLYDVMLINAMNYRFLCANQSLSFFNELNSVKSG